MLAWHWPPCGGRATGRCRADAGCPAHVATLVTCFLVPFHLQCCLKPEPGWDGDEEATSSRVLCCALSCSRVLQSVVLLSDSQLHLFLQSQLSVPEIEACVQGRGSLTVSDAILCYAMSNCGWAQEERQSTSHLAKGDQLNR